MKNNRAEVVALSGDAVINQNAGQVEVMHKLPMHPLLWKLLLLVSVLFYSSFSILVHLSEKDGKLEFSSASVILLTEILKLIFSMIMYSSVVRERGSCGYPPWVLILPFAIPALLYAINNNLGVLLQLQMDPATYQVMCNFKILSTAILFRIIIRKPITFIQWMALGILLIAGICHSYGGLVTKFEDGVTGAGTLHITVKGLLMLSVYCTISGLSGVSTEYIMKSKQAMSIHLQNSLLYMFGIVFNAMLFIGQAQELEEKDASFNLLRGYTIWTWLIVITQAFNGIIMGAIMKHGSNITRLFVISTAMAATAVLSMLIFGLKLNIFFCLSIVMVVVALFLYHR